VATIALAPMTCRQLTELTTEHLEGALDTAGDARFDAHVALCPMCRTHLWQLRTTLRVLALLRSR
jgi:predicted anti-sigma-YlaC factor YlaD